MATRVAERLMPQNSATPLGKAAIQGRPKPAGVFQCLVLSMSRFSSSAKANCALHPPCREHTGSKSGCMESTRIPEICLLRPAANPRPLSSDSCGATCLRNQPNCLHRSGYGGFSVLQFPSTRPSLWPGCKCATRCARIAGGSDSVGLSARVLLWLRGRHSCPT